MTFASLLVALVATIALFYGNFLLAYAVDLISGRGVPPVRFLGTAAMAAASTALLAVALRARSRLPG